MKRRIEDMTDEELRELVNPADAYHRRMASAFVDGSAPKTERSAEPDGDDHRAAHERRMNRAFIEPGDDAA